MITDQQIEASLDLCSPRYIEIKVYCPDDFYAYIDYMNTNHIILVYIDWLRTTLCVQNTAGSNTRRIYLFPQGQVL